MLRQHQHPRLTIDQHGNSFVKERMIVNMNRMVPCTIFAPSESHQVKFAQKLM